MKRRRNPDDVKLTLCDLRNPKRWHRKALNRPWRSRDKFHDAVDDINWEQAVKRKKRGASPSRSNPSSPRKSRKGAKARTWWKQLSAKRRMVVARSVLGRMNPKRSDGKRTGSRRRNPSCRNPKRDGSSTRGEQRRVKYLAHLKSIVDRSDAARQEFTRLTGAVAKAGTEPIGKRAVAHAVKDHVETWKAKHAKELAGEAAPASVAEAVAAPAPVEHPEVRHIQSRLTDMDVLLRDYQDQIKQLAGDDMLEDEEARLQEEISKLARAKAKLREKLVGLATVTATNPRGRRSIRWRRIPRSVAARIRSASAKADRAMRALRTALARGRSFLRSH